MVNFGGDVNQDGVVDGVDGSLVDNAAYNFVTGYVPEDCNGDDNVDGSDAALVDNNAFNFVTAVLPSGPLVSKNNSKIKREVKTNFPIVKKNNDSKNKKEIKDNYFDKRIKE